MWSARAIVMFLVLSLVSGKIFETRCKLVRELLRIGMNNDMFLGQWVCLIEKVSKRNTSAFTSSPSGKKSYGLYQIPKEWCREKKPGGLCNLSCEALLDEDIRDDTACALQIENTHGFKYWTLWQTRCKNDNFITNEIYKCPDLLYMNPRRSSSQNSQQRRGPIRRRRSVYVHKVTRLRRSKSRHIN